MRSAVQVAERGRRGTRGPATGGAGGGVARRWGRDPATRRERRQRRLEQRDRLRLAPDHQAVALLEPEHPAAGADVQVADARGLELPVAADVVVLVGLGPYVDARVAPPPPPP